MKYYEIISQNNILTQIGKIADEMGIDAYVVGGYVRDFFFNIKSKDIDIVCIGSGIELAKQCSKKLNSKNEIVVYKNFGTAMIKLNNLEIEFVGARKESYNTNSRKPIITNGTLEDDQNRRDFTINSMAVCINKINLGLFLDPFNGMNDLSKKIIKTPLEPDKTFSDDPLRILRAIRFATKFGFNIEKKTLASIKKNVSRLQIVSKERICSEMNKTILTDQPSRGLLIYFKTGLLKFILPELVALQNKEVINGHTHKDNFYHTLKVLDNVSEVSNNLWLRWAAILHDIAKPLTKRYNHQKGFTFHGHEDLGAKMVYTIFKRLKLPLNHNTDYVAKLIKLHLRPIALAKDIVTDSAIRRLIYDAGDDLEDLLKLCRADITSGNIQTVKKYLNNFDIVEQKIRNVENIDSIRNLKPVITGEIIMKTFNIKPSKIIGEIKNEIKDAIIEGIIKNTFQDTFYYMLKIGKKKSLNHNLEFIKSKFSHIN